MISGPTLLFFSIVQRHDSSKSKKSARGNTSKDGSYFEDQDYDVEHIGKSIDSPIASRGEGTVENDDSD